MLGYGSTSRKNVLGRVQIPVVPGATARARPRPDRKVQFGEQISTRRTGLRAGVPAVDRHKGPTSTLAFVGKLAPELAPPAVGYGPRQPPVAEHVLHGQILDHDQISASHQAGAGLVQQVSAGVADLTMRTSDLGLGFAPIRGPVPAAGQPPLVTRETASLTFQVPRVADPLAIGCHREVLNAEVDANVMPGRLDRGRLVGVNGERHIPTAIRLAGDRDHARIQANQVDTRPRPSHRQRPVNLRDMQLAILHPEPRAGVVRRLPAVTALEPWIPRSAVEEAFESGVLMAQPLPQRDAGHFGQKRQLLRLLPVCQRRVSLLVRGRLTTQAVGRTSVGESLVPHQAYTSKGAVEHRSLFRCRVSPTPVRRTHVRKSTTDGRQRATYRRPPNHLLESSASGGVRIPPRHETQDTLRRVR